MSWLRQSGALCSAERPGRDGVLLSRAGRRAGAGIHRDLGRGRRKIEEGARRIQSDPAVGHRCRRHSGVHLFDAAGNLFLSMAISLGILWIWREACRVLFFRPILRNCERTPDSWVTSRAREIQAAVLSWRTLYFQAAVLPLLFAASVAVSSWPALPVELRISLPILIALAGLNIVHLFVLKCRQPGAKAAAPTA